MRPPSADSNEARVDWEDLVERLRPILHRYCSRMTGSVIDGEDVVQEALLNAFAALSKSHAIENPDRWLVRIAHNAALDFLRRRSRHPAALFRRGPRHADGCALRSRTPADRRIEPAHVHAAARRAAQQRRTHGMGESSPPSLSTPVSGEGFSGSAKNRTHSFLLA